MPIQKWASVTSYFTEELETMILATDDAKITEANAKGYCNFSPPRGRLIRLFSIIYLDET
jgi:hypothetical protein